MPVRIRLKRMGRRHKPSYRVAVVDGRRARDSQVIEEVGSFDPMVIDERRQTTRKADRIQYWISVGAQPSDTVRRMLVKHGVIEGDK